MTTWWETDEWRAYEAAYGSTVSRVDELAASDWLTHVVDLSKSEEELWKAIPKTMRQAIRKGQKRYSIEVNTDIGLFIDYVKVHATANGGTHPRSLATYDIQASWLANGHALIATAERDDMTCVGACLVIHHGKWVYYASGPSIEKDVMPALIWSAMLETRYRGFRWFEVGWVGHATDEKGKNIERFKQRWGGVNMPAKDAPLLCGNEVKA